MDFLNKIKQFFSRRKQSKNSFKEQIQKEKKQKYLFRNDDIQQSANNFARKKGFVGNKNSEGRNIFSTFFQHATENVGEYDKKYITGGLGIFLLLLVGYIIALSPYFRISPNKILITPLTDGVDINIISRSIEGIYGKSIFLLNTDEISKSIKKNLKNAENIEVDRLFPNGVKILVKSLPINIETTISNAEEKRFGLSANGVLVPLSDIKNSNFRHKLNIFSEELESDLFLSYKKVLSDKNTLVISKIFDIFEKEWPDIKMARSNFFLLENELHIILESKTKIILSLQSEQNNLQNEISKSLQNQLITLQTYIKHHQEKLINGSISYLDIRIPGKIFVCSGESICQKNLTLVYGKAYE